MTSRRTDAPAPVGSKRNEAGGHHLTPSFPPIDPRLCYPWRRLRDFGFGARGIAALVKAGLHPLQFGKLRFFAGSSLIAVIERHQGNSEAVRTSAERCETCSETQ